MKEQIALKPKTVGEIFRILSPKLKPTHRRQFIGLARSLSACWRKVEQLNCLVEDLITPAKEDLVYGESLLADVAKRREATGDFIYHPKNPFTKGRFQALRGRFQVGLCLVPEHPWLEPLSHEQAVANEFLEQAKERLAQAQLKSDLNLKPQIEKAQKDISKAESTLLDFSEKKVVYSDQASTNYALLLPQRADSLIRIYGNTFGLDPERLVNLPEFMDKIEPLIEVNKKRGDRFYSMLHSSKLRPLIDIPENDLPKSMKDLLQSWASYQFTLRLSRSGVVAEPELPHLFNK